MDIKAIATEYCGITFRSRLEATFWIYMHSFWDESDSPIMTYEPERLEFWNPDFRIEFPNEQWVYVEVKPNSYEFKINNYLKSIKDDHNLWLFSPDVGCLQIEFKEYYHIVPIVDIKWKQALNDLYFKIHTNG